MTDFYYDKPVLVIGGAGFVGTHLVHLLLRAGARVSILDNLSRGSADNVPDDALFVYGDAAREGPCRDAIKGQVVVFNLAAEVAGVIWNQSHHVEMFSRNVLAQMTPLKIAAEYGVARYLNVSSVCIYAPEHLAPCLEENGHLGQPTPANQGYSLAKRMGEKLAGWHAESGLHAVSVRPSNIYGPGDYFDDRAHVIPALIRKCTEDEEIVANGTGRERREFLYVTDVARGMMAAAERGRAGEVYNLGTNGDTCVTIAELLTTIQRLTLTSDKPVRFVHAHDPGDSVRWSDASKASCELDWEHKVGLEEGLRETILWWYFIKNGRTGGT